jgi:signal recognition particle GTPase
MCRGLVGSKNLTQESMQPVLDKLKDHLIAKNVATDIAHKLCVSVAAKLEGKVSTRKLLWRFIHDFEVTDAIYYDIMVIV